MGYYPPSLAAADPSPTPVTFTGAVGAAFNFPLRLIIAVCVRLRIHPNLLTFTGVVISVAAGWALAVGDFLTAGVIMVGASVFDFAQFITGGLFANRFITRDQVKNLKVDNTVGARAQGFAELGLTPRSMNGLLETYLYCYRPYGQYTAITESAKHLKTE